MNTAIIIIDSETIKAGLKIPKLGFLNILIKTKIMYLQLIKAIFFPNEIVYLLFFHSWASLYFH